MKRKLVAELDLATLEILERSASEMGLTKESLTGLILTNYSTSLKVAALHPPDFGTERTTRTCLISALSEDCLSKKFLSTNLLSALQIATGISRNGVLTTLHLLFGILALPYCGATSRLRDQGFDVAHLLKALKTNIDETSQEETETALIEIFRKRLVTKDEIDTLSFFRDLSEENCLALAFIKDHGIRDL